MSTLSGKEEQGSKGHSTLKLVACSYEASLERLYGSQNNLLEGRKEGQKIPLPCISELC